MSDRAPTVFIGMDVSKGYIDMHAINHAGSKLAAGRFDDTATGHETLRRLIHAQLETSPEEVILVGVEASGGLERNWVRMLRAYDPRVIVAVLNPLAVKRFLAHNLHRSVTDAVSAAGIARYLASGLRLHETRSDPALDGLRELYHCAMAAMHRSTESRNQLQSLLPRVHPDLVQFVRSGIPDWVLQVLGRYPTAAALARAKRSTLAAIKHVTDARADALIAAARQSVASQTDAFTGQTIQFLTRDILQQAQTIDELKATICAALHNDPAVQVLRSIPGIGEWSAACLRIEIGLIERFPSAEALTAYAGLDPCYHQSGDRTRTMRISKHGRRHIRALLYMCAVSAVRANPVVAAFYDRLKGAGKPTLVALTAAMRKLLHLVYACWVTDRPFDAHHEARRCERLRTERRSPTAHAGETGDGAVAGAALGGTDAGPRITAPVTRREAQRRRAAALPQTPARCVVRGPGTTPRRENESDRS